MHVYIISQHSTFCFPIDRNYLDYVEESVRDWIGEEEAKYQAKLLSQELDKMREEEERASRAAEKANKKSSKKSGKGPGSIVTNHS